MSADDDFFAQFIPKSPQKSQKLQELLALLPDSATKCPNCHKNKVTDLPTVMRRSDEPGGNQYRCEFCGFCWRKK
jgi:DNA-directed RNA polymerase subunit M/transcription elongation factor TFIIS